MHRLKKWFYVFLGLLLVLVIWYHKLIGYGISQGYGQLKIILNTKPVEEVLTDPAFPDSLKSRLKLIEEIRQFAFDSLGINPSDNYTTVYDQKGKPILWVVTAAEPFRLEPKRWEFPFLGSVSYKGFFDYKKAEKEAEIWKKEGLDISIDEVSGWSTLGWFKDPVLSEMLKRPPGSLANLIIHELTHGTLYVKDSVEFNENLASFVGDKGAVKFLAYKYGANSKEFRQYSQSRKFNKEYTALVLKHADRLDSLYGAFNESMSVAQKKHKKSLFLKEIELELKNFLALFKLNNLKNQKELESMNNNFFLDFRRYRENLGFFEKEYSEKFNSDLKAYMEYLKSKYPSL